MLTKYKAIIADFDGTLGDENGNISKQVQEAIKKWINNGRYFSIATGRQYLHIKEACKLLKLTAPQIVRGGSEIVEAQNGKIIDAEYLESQTLKKLIKILLSNKIPFTAEGGEYLYTLTGKPFAAVPGVKYQKISKMPCKGIAKIVLWTEALDQKTVEDFFDSKITLKFPSIGIVKSDTPFNKTWQITSIKATKHLAVLKLATMLNFQPKEIIGIGDNYNDYSLLTACGYKVAMGNSPDALKQIADFIAPSYQQNGVATIIDKFIK